MTEKTEDMVTELRAFHVRCVDTHCDHGDATETHHCAACQAEYPCSALRAADRLAALTTPQEAKWEHGVIGGDGLLARLMDTLAYYHCRSVNPKADSPYLGYHAMSEDQREFLREKQREAAEEVLRMWHAESRPPAPQEGDARERMIDVLVMTDLSDYAGTDMGMINAAFIASARSSVPRLIAALEAVREVADAYGRQPDVMEPCGAAAQSIRFAIEDALKGESDDPMP